MERFAQKPMTPDEPSRPGVPNVPDQPQKPNLPPDPGAPKTPQPPPVTPGTPPTFPPTPPTSSTKWPRVLAALLVALAFGSSISARAQSIHYTGVEPTYVMVNGKMAGFLMLTDVQRAKLQALESEHQAERDALLEQRYDLEEKDFRARMNTLTGQYVERVRAVLPANEFKRWREMGGGGEGFEKEPADKRAL